jgi:hypothetical protein
MEITMGIQLALGVMKSGIRGAMLAYVLWNQLRLRYWAPESRPYHLQAWAAIEARVAPLLARAPPGLRAYIDMPIRWFNAPGQAQAHRD